MPPVTNNSNSADSNKSETEVAHPFKTPAAEPFSGPSDQNKNKDELQKVFASRLPTLQSGYSRPKLKQTESKSFVKEIDSTTTSAAGSNCPNEKTHSGANKTKDRSSKLNKSSTNNTSGSDVSFSNSSSKRADTTPLNKHPNNAANTLQEEAKPKNVISFKNNLESNSIVQKNTNAADISSQTANDIKDSKRENKGAMVPNKPEASHASHPDGELNAKSEPTEVLNKIPAKGALQDVKPNISNPQTKTTDSPKVAHVTKKNEPASNNRIVVESETVDSTPIVSLASYDKTALFPDRKDLNRNDEKDKKPFEKNNIIEDKKNSTLNRNIYQSSGNSHLKSAQIDDDNRKLEDNSSINNDQDIKYGRAKTRVASTFNNNAGDISRNGIVPDSDNSEQFIDTHLRVNEAAPLDSTTAEYTELEDGTLMGPDGKIITINKGPVNSGVSHAAYTRSLRNKRSILMDASSMNNSNTASGNIISSKNNVQPQSSAKNTSVTNSTNNLAGTVNIKSSVPTAVPSTFEDDARSITSSIKKPKAKQPKLKKVTSSRADIFEAQVEGALYDDQNSDGNETFVYESRGHSRDNSTNTIELDHDNDDKLADDNQSFDGTVISRISNDNPEGNENSGATGIDSPHTEYDRNSSRKPSSVSAPFHGLINDQASRSDIGATRPRRKSTLNSHNYVLENDQPDANKGAKFNKQGKALKKTKLLSRSLYPAYEDTQNDDYRFNENSYKDNNASFHKSNAAAGASSIASASMKDFYFDSNSALMSNVSEKNYGDDQGSVNNGEFYTHANTQQQQQQQQQQQKVSNRRGYILTKQIKNSNSGNYGVHLSSSRENTSDSELEYTTDDFTYPKFTRYKKMASNYHVPSDTHVLNNNAPGSNSSTLTSINRSNRYVSRNSSALNLNKNRGNEHGGRVMSSANDPTTVNNNTNNNNNNNNNNYNDTVIHRKRSNSRSRLLNYHPRRYQQLSQSSKNRQQYGLGDDNMPEKNMPSPDPNNTKMGHQFNPYDKQPLPNQLRTTISKLFDPQGTNLKRYSGVQEDFNVDDIEDENYDDDVNYFDYDLEDGSEVNESTPLNFDYYSSYTRPSLLRSVDNTKPQAFRRSRIRSNSNLNGKSNAFPYYGPAGYHQKQRKTSFQMIQSTFWGILLMISFLSLGFVCGFFLASTKDLADVNIVDIKHVLVSVDELIFDIQCDGINPGFTSIIIQDVDLDLFVKTRYLDDDDDDYERLFNYQTFFIGNINRLEYPLTFPSNLLDKKKVQAAAGIRLIDPGKNASDPTYNDDILYHATHSIDLPQNQSVIESASTLEHSSPRSPPLTDLESRESKTRQENWKKAIKYPFELIVRGKFNYKLPFSSTVRAIAVHKSTCVDPSSSS